MKGLVFIVCVTISVTLASGLTEEQKEKVKIVHKECQDDPATHADENKLSDSYKGVEVTGLGAHFLCMSKKLGMQKDNGNVDREAIKRKLSDVITVPEKLQEAVDKCAVQKATPEDTAEHVLKCFHDYAGHVLHAHDHHH
uniref:Odorant-binding protein 9 n=2 Tax=Neoptera TaxID=33340 RepID=A0A6B9RYZ2_9HEMI|nr:odorant binding protein 16 [Xylotrechus quadripes]QHI06955.1 odorant-binding protein 9 [Helopeltis theivora]